MAAVTDAEGGPDARIQPITMPKWGLSMKVGKVVEWLVEEGETVRPGMDLADIETEKIAGTLESTQDGVLRRIVAHAGENVPVSGVIAVVAPPEVSDADVEALAERARADLEAGVGPEEVGPDVRSVEAAGRRISVATVGEGEEHVLLVHGFGGDRNSWLFVQEPLVAGPGAAALTVHALDLPGHGESAKDVGDGTLNVLVESVLGTLDALGVERAHIVGHSLGGAVVAAVAARAPGRVASLTLVAPAGFGTEVNAAFLRGFTAASSRRELRPLLGDLFADPGLVTRQLVDDLLRYKRLDGVAASLQAALGVLLTEEDTQAIDTPGTLAELDGVPVTVVWGAADQVLPAPSDASVLGDGVELVIASAAGHMAHMEAAQTVLEVIERRLTSQP